MTDAEDVLNEQQIAEFKEAFSVFDKDRDGKVTESDLKAVLPSFQLPSKDETVEQMLEDIDISGTGAIDFTEFLTAVSQKFNTLDSEEELLEAFRAFDPDQNGTISISQFRKLLTELGNRFNDEELEVALAAAPVDGDNNVKYEDFVKKLLAK